MNALRPTAIEIATAAIDAVKPDAAVRRALSSATFDPAGEVRLVAAGKAAWRMAAATIAGPRARSRSERAVRGMSAVAMASRMVRSSAPSSRAFRAARARAGFLRTSEQARLSPWQRRTASAT